MRAWISSRTVSACGGRSAWNVTAQSGAEQGMRSAIFKSSEWFCFSYPYDEGEININNVQTFLLNSNNVYFLKKNNTLITIIIK